MKSFVHEKRPARQCWHIKNQSNQSKQKRCERLNSTSLLDTKTDKVWNHFNLKRNSIFWQMETVGLESQMICFWRIQHHKWIMQINCCLIALKAGACWLSAPLSHLRIPEQLLCRLPQNRSGNYSSTVSGELLWVTATCSNRSNKVAIVLTENGSEQKEWCAVISEQS